MARVVKQYRFYNEGDRTRNQPSTINIENLVNGKVFESPSCYPILQLGIQALPGTKFYLNSSIEPVVVGFTGIYELDLENQAEIVKLNFNDKSIQTINDNANGYLIVDVLYDDGTEDN
jgi:hypothetical protein